MNNIKEAFAVVVDVHAHIFEKIAGIKDMQPLHSDKYGMVRCGNRRIPFHPPYFVDTSSTPELLLAHMDRYGVDKAVLMSNALYGYHNDYSAEAVRHFPDRFRAIALVDVLEGEPAVAELEELHKAGFLTGLKIEVESAFACKPQASLDDDFMRPFWDYFNRTDQPVFIHTLRWKDFEACRQIVSEFKNIRIVFCHLGAEAILERYPEEQTPLNEMLGFLKKNERCMLELSGVYCLVDKEYPYPVTVDLIYHCYNALGADRLMWGSDYPGTLDFGTFRQIVEHIPRHCSTLPQSVVDKIMGENADSLFW